MFFSNITTAYRNILILSTLSVYSAVASAQETPLYNWWNSQLQDNRATTSPEWWMSEEKIEWQGEHIVNGPAKQGYKLYRLEGLIFHPKAKQPEGTVPLVSWYSQDRGDYFTTTKPDWIAPDNYREGERFIRQGYRIARIEGYLFSPHAPRPDNTVPVFSWWHPDRQDNFLTTDPSWSISELNSIEYVGEEIKNAPRRDGYRLYRLEGYAKKPSRSRFPSLELEAQVAVSHTENVSRAADDLESQLLKIGNGPHLSNLRDSGKRFRMHGVDSGGTSPHYQGIGFLRDISLANGSSLERHRRAVLSYNYGDGLIISSAQINSGVSDGLTDFTDNLLRFQDRYTYFDIMKEPRMGNHAHPGGLQTHGDFIAIAMEEPMESQQAAAYFIKVDGMTPRFITSLPLGSGGAPGGLDIDSAAASGFIKLLDGYLIAISGANHGTEGIWFYRTVSNFITPNTEWRFVDFWTPDRLTGKVCNIKAGKVSLDCYIGAGGGLSLISNSDQGVYLIATTGTDSGKSLGKNDEYAQAFRLNVEETDTRTFIQMEPKWFAKKKLGSLRVWREYSMRWAGAAQTTEDGRLIILNTERGRRKKGARGATDGILRIAE